MDVSTIDMRIVIPCYNEPDILSTVKSLFSCKQEMFRTELIIVVNTYRISPPEVKDLNRKTFEDLNVFARQHHSPFIRLDVLWVEDIPGHQTGAGLPRKIGMDEAVKRFKREEKENGIIISLDADCVVENNYLQEIYFNFKKWKLKSATIEFRHPVEHLNIDDKIRKATEVYEEYLRYYRQALEYTGFPYAYYTIGSAFAVTAEAYSQVGGMGKQQAGEDFYFLHKVFPLGKTKFIDTTCVYPAARESERVPFGTGPAISKLIEGTVIRKFSYQLAAFTELKRLFDALDRFFELPEKDISKEMTTFPVHLQKFLSENEFMEKIKEIKQYTSTLRTFKKRFFSYFTAFRILKYLNYTHPSVYELKDVKEEYHNYLNLKTSPSVGV